MEASRNTSPSSRTQATLALLVSCAVWGASFNWVKDGQDALSAALVDALGNPDVTHVGPAAFLAFRFGFVALCWVLMFPRSIRGLTRESWIGGVLAGVFLGAGSLLQHYGLARASEALTAFLTSLTVLFTPLIGVTFLRQRVSPPLLFSVVLAVIGIGLMTSFRPEGGFDLGALLGLLCAVAMTGQVLVVDRYSRADEIWRTAFLQFSTATVVYVAATLMFEGGSASLKLLVTTDILLRAEILLPLLLTAFFASILAYGLMFAFQAKMSPTEAALVYSTEPLFATAYAWIAAGRGVSLMALVGAGLVVIANCVAIFAKREDSSEPREDGLAPQASRY